MARTFPDKTLNTIMKALLKSTKRLTGSAVKMVDSDSKWIEGDILFFDPIRETEKFVRKPFGTSVREQMRAHLSKAVGEMCGVMDLTDKYPWLITKEDRSFLEDVWLKVDSIVVHKKK